MKNIFDTKTVTFTELLGNGKIYKIPSFQRDFSWTEENWEDLWNDIKFKIRLSMLSGLAGENSIWPSIWAWSLIKRVVS